MSDQAAKIPDADDRQRRIVPDMNVLEALATAFINTFGITQPTEQTRRRAAWFIFGLMVAVLVIVVAGAVTLIRIL